MVETKDAANGNLFLDRAAIRTSRGGLTMPEGAHLHGVGKKEQRMYEHIKERSEGRSLWQACQRGRCEDSLEVT